MIKGDKEFLDQVVGTHICPLHPKLALTVAWHQTEGYVIRCGGGHYPDEVTRHPSLTEAYLQGEELPEPIQGRVEKAVAEKTGLARVDEEDLLAGLLPMKDLGTSAPLDSRAIALLFAFAEKYRLDVYRGHVVMMYGQPYIGLDGYLYHAFRSGKPYTMASRPLDENERKIYQVGEGDHAWLAKIDILEPVGHFTGLGIVTQKEMTATSKKDITKLAAPVVAAHPWQLAQKRAEWQAMRRAFPIGETETKEEE